MQGVCVTSAPADTTFGLRCESTGADDASAGEAAADGAGASDISAETTDAAASDVFAADAGSSDVAVDAAGREVSCVDVCVGLDPMSSICSRRCVFGSTGECAPASGGLRRGGCLFVTKGGGIGDLGYCGELCDCNDDCTESTFVCDAFDDMSLESAFGRKGVCTPTELVVNHPLACED